MIAWKKAIIKNLHTMQRTVLTALALTAGFTTGINIESAA